VQKCARNQCGDAHINLGIRTANIPLFIVYESHCLVTFQFALTSALSRCARPQRDNVRGLFQPQSGRAQRDRALVNTTLQCQVLYLYYHVLQLCSTSRDTLNHWMLYKAEAFEQMRLKVISCWSHDLKHRICSLNQVLTRTSWRGCAQREIRWEGSCYC
jgi:hypothetical protein